jgi:hypothetical protein
MDWRQLPLAAAMVLLGCSTSEPGSHTQLAASAPAPTPPPTSASSAVVDDVAPRAKAAKPKDTRRGFYTSVMLTGEQHDDERAAACERAAVEAVLHTRIARDHEASVRKLVLQKRVGLGFAINAEAPRESRYVEVCMGVDGPVARSCPTWLRVDRHNGVVDADPAYGDGDDHGKSSDYAVPAPYGKAVFEACAGW